MKPAATRERLATTDPRSPMATTLTKLLTVDEVAELMRSDRQKIWRLVRIGSLPAVRIGSRIFFHPDDLAAWLHANTVNKTETDTDRALRWLGEHEAEREHPLCPRCAKREQGDSGLCAVCAADKRRVTEERVEQDRARKLDWWHSDKGRAAKERRKQRRHTTTPGDDDAQ